MKITRIGKNALCEVWRVGAWRYVQYANGIGWWKWERKWRAA